MSTSYQKGQVPNCPHCKEPLDAPVEDLVIPGHVGAESCYQTDCVNCFKDFTVEASADGTFVVDVA